MFLRKLINALKPPIIPYHSDEEEKILLQRAVASSSTGNVLLQSGLYMTSDDVTKLRNKVLGQKCK